MAKEIGEGLSEIVGGFWPTRTALQQGAPHADGLGVASRQAEHRRFSASVLTFSLRTRLVLSAPLVLVVGLLVVNFVRDACSDDPRPAAMMLFVLGPWSFLTWQFVRPLWRHDVEWSRSRQAGAAEADRVREEIAAGPRPHLNMLTPDASSVRDQREMPTSDRGDERALA